MGAGGGEGAMVAAAAGATRQHAGLQGELLVTRHTGLPAAGAPGGGRVAGAVANKRKSPTHDGNTYRGQAHTHTRPQGLLWVRRCPPPPPLQRLGPPQRPPATLTCWAQQPQHTRAMQSQPQWPCRRRKGKGGWLQCRACMQERRMQSRCRRQWQGRRWRWGPYPACVCSCCTERRHCRRRLGWWMEQRTAIGKLCSRCGRRIRISMIRLFKTHNIDTGGG